MASLGFQTNVEMAEDFNTFELVSEGWKKVIIVKTELRDTSTGGKMLVLHNEVQGVEVPSEAGAIVQDRLNIINKSETAQKIGRAALAKIAHECMGLGPISDSDVLCGHLYEIKVIVSEFESNKEKGKMLKSNEIKSYRKATNSTASSVKTSTQANGEIDW